MTAPASNAEKLKAFVNVRLEAAAAMPPVDAIWFCRRWADYVEAELRRLSDTAGRDADLPPHLSGLSAPDLSVAHGAFLSAATRYEVAVRAALAA